MRSENELEYYTPLKKGFILQSKGARFKKNLPPRYARRNYFLAALCAAQHGLYTSNLLPTPMFFYE